ncbi:Arc family DNA-binding protein [Paenirhodobacter populi]|uniref:Arc family DNA-binding protein n=1 Tax=Paenirhodobacter populi TaxID=2306993 RepID=A0A443IQH1_9RHOB|nr:Arc family DNA-binding protein [Sinirhodobacter populi]RWR08515.1 Arc family DNA-binding protein [Sinirhodobacter populi]
MMTIMPAQGTEGVVQTMIRWPLSMREKLKADAKSNGRSLNTHIVMLLGEVSGAAAGGDLGGKAPAAGSDAAAL